MAGCETQNYLGQGNKDWAFDRLLTWALTAAGIGGASMAALLYAVIGGAVFGGLTGLAALGAVVFAAAAAGVVATFIGYEAEWFTRLKVQSPSEITMVGWVICVGRNLGIPTVPSFCDGDWTCNLAPHLVGETVNPADPYADTWAVTHPSGLTVDEVRTRTAPGAEFAGLVYDPEHLDTGVVPPEIPILHTEIGSHIGDYFAVGGAVGTVVGAAAGIAVGIAICIGLSIVTFGLAAAVCALVIALAAAAGAFLGGVAGQLIGAGIGAIADWVTDFDEAGDSVSVGCLITETGTWVTDRSHQHNEIHDISSIQIIECGDVRRIRTPLATAGAVGIGRHPTGPDP